MSSGVEFTSEFSNIAFDKSGVQKEIQNLMSRCGSDYKTFCKMIDLRKQVSEYNQQVHLQNIASELQLIIQASEEKYSDFLRRNGGVNGADVESRYKTALEVAAKSLCDFKSGTFQDDSEYHVYNGTRHIPDCKYYDLQCKLESAEREVAYIETCVLYSL
jgi:hypothetical protein